VPVELTVETLGVGVAPVVLAVLPPMAPVVPLVDVLPVVDPPVLGVEPADGEDIAAAWTSNGAKGSRPVCSALATPETVGTDDGLGVAVALGLTVAFGVVVAT
jgi:hypothetical protein